MKKLEACIVPLVNRQILVQQESRALAEFRDTFLPKLLSGEIGVSGLENRKVVYVRYNN